MVVKITIGTKQHNCLIKVLIKLKQVFVYTVCKQNMLSIVINKHNIVNTNVYENTHLD